VARQTEKRKNLDPAVIEMRKELARKIAAACAIAGRESYRHFRSGLLPSNGANTMLFGHVPFCSHRSMFLPKVKLSKPRKRSPLLSMFLRYADGAGGPQPGRYAGA